MDKQFYEKVFSSERMKKYFERYDNDQKAIEHYHLNISLSESFYPILSIFEIAFRNSMNRELVKYFGTNAWYLRIGSTTGLRNLNDSINNAQRHIINRNEQLTSSKVVAELSLGFWVRLLNTEYERVLWKPLRKAFPYLEKKNRKRKKVSAPINKIRNFRNRIFHHEPITWNLNEIEKIHQEILTVINWLNKDLPEIVRMNDNVSNVIENVKQKLYS